MKTADIRRNFIEFFKQKNHTFVPSSSLIPAGDQTILFTVAGMAQFKNALTGKEIRPYKRATNSQKCLRVSDLDDVGLDGRHLTMFEMLGSWSFGDYYKEDAIAWAYELVRDVMKLDLNKLWVTVHHTDDEAFNIWLKVGVPAERIRRLGDKDNFWAMGPTGPCGPCSELYLDQGECVGKCKDKNYECKKGPGCDCDRYLEFWNLVFMQYNRKDDGTLEELPMKSVDTGCGLERFSALLNNKTSVYEIDTFQNIRAAIAERIGFTLSENNSDTENANINVIADHIRALTFTLADGAYFTNEGRGYVIRRVLRRAVRFAHKLNPSLAKDNSFLADLVPAVIKEFGEYYPEIVDNEKRITEAIKAETTRFNATLENGLDKLNQFMEVQKQKGEKVLNGEQIFILHDSFGFPADLTRIICTEKGFGVNLEEFTSCMKLQKEKSKADAKFYKFDEDDSHWIMITNKEDKSELNFAGYSLWQGNSLFDGKEVLEINIPTPNVRRVRQLKNKLFELIIANTPFYAESGGQVADTGWFRTENSLGRNVFELVDVRKTPSAIVHVLKHAEFSNEEANPLAENLVKEIFTGEVTALLDIGARRATAGHHTATHLLQKALQVVIGEEVRQAGSMVSPSLLRFDFTCSKGLTSDEIRQVEELVNQEILINKPVVTHENVEISTAKKMGAMAIFDEKYEDQVRVVEVNGYSMELCGGTHVPQTGCIGLFKIISEGSVTSGVRRIEAITGKESYNYVLKLKTQIQKSAEEAKCPEADLTYKIHAMREENKALERKITTLQSRIINLQIVELLASQTEILPGVKLIYTLQDANSASELELVLDRIKEKAPGIVVAGANIDNKASVMVSVNPSVTKEHKGIMAGTIVKILCEMLGGKGGGKPDFARGGGTNPEKLPEVFAKIPEIIKGMIK